MADGAEVEVREVSRQRIVEAAADLLALEGREAVTTRAVAAAAGGTTPGDLSLVR
ncbi:hypothetical protein [Kibdelosporangium aridum]|uniref:hypothetical protein n=1 Tax=Kibdelosporangium aridum TaxID=2030 RepID=UPI0035EDC9BF